MALALYSLTLGNCFQDTRGRVASLHAFPGKVAPQFTLNNLRNGGLIRPGSGGLAATPLKVRKTAYRVSASSSTEDDEVGDVGSQIGKTGYLGDSALRTGSSGSSSAMEALQGDKGSSLDSLYGVGLDWLEKLEQRRAEEESARNRSLDSIMGVDLDWREKSEQRRAEEERGRNTSWGSMEGKELQDGNVSVGGRNVEWRSIFPAYMQSKENEVDRSQDEGGDRTAVDDPRRESRTVGATKAAVAAVASVKEFDSQYGSKLLSSALPVLLSGQSKSSKTSTGKLEDLISDDPIWAAIRAEAWLEAEREPLLSSFLYASILAHSCFERSLGFVLANRLNNATLLATQLLDIFDDVFQDDMHIRQAIRLDVQAVKDRDPSCTSYSLALLYLKGYHALQAYRIAHALWCRGQKVLALALQSRISEVFAVDIHPAARLGKAILLDHGTGVVIGETAVVGDRVSMLQGVTLGGTGKVAGDRHPKIKEGVLIGAGATILGNITVGRGAMVASGSLVLKDVPPHSMVAGTPAKVVGYLEEPIPSLTMKQDATKGFCEQFQERHQALLETRLEHGAGI